MAQALGYFKPTSDGFEGIISTLTIKATVDIVPNADKKNDMEPDYRIFASTGLEMGGIWKRIAKSTGAECLSATLTAPELGRKVYANLVPTNQKDGKHVLLWNAQ